MRRLLSAILMLMLSACSTERLLRYEEGNLIAGRQNVRKTSNPSKITVLFEETSESVEPRLKVSVRKISPTQETWEDTYSKIGVYEKRCRGWMRGADAVYSGRDEYCQFRSGDFAVSHLLLYGFLLDLTIPFQDYDNRTIEVTRPEAGTISKADSKFVDVEEEVHAKSLKLTVGKKSAVSPF